MEPRRTAVPSHITESVSYAKVSSDYLIGQAASIHHLAHEVQSQVVQGDKDQASLSPEVLQLAQASTALKAARKNLLEDFQQFEADSSAWVRFLKNGDEREYDSGDCPRVFLKEAVEIMAAVNRARREMQKACAIFSCGHEVVRQETCPTATRLRSSNGSCSAVYVYPPRQRTDPCLHCWTKQMDMIEVSDTPKGKDDLPLSGESPYTPTRHIRKLFRAFKSADDPAKDAATLFWTPQGHRYDPERKKWSLQRSKAPRPEDLKASKRQMAQKPSAAPATSKKKTVAPIARPTQASKAKASEARDISKGQGYRCRDARLHNSRFEAEACTFCRLDNHFDHLPRLPPPKRQKRARESLPPTQEDIGENIVVASRRSSAGLSSLRTPSPTPSTPVQAPHEELYPTPPVSQLPKGRASNTSSVNHSLASGAERGVPSPGDMDVNDGDGVGPPGTYRHHANFDDDEGSQPSTTHVSETPLRNQQGQALRPNIGHTVRSVADRALAEARVGLEEALRDALTVRPGIQTLLQRDIDTDPGLVERLRTRISIEAGKLTAKDEEIQQAQEDSDTHRIAAEAFTVEMAKVRQSRKRAWSLVMATLVLLSVYLVWCRLNSAEFAYQRKRRFAMYGLNGEDY